MTSKVTNEYLLFIKSKIHVKKQYDGEITVANNLTITLAADSIVIIGLEEYK